MAHDPFGDETQVWNTEEKKEATGPVMEQKDNWVSFSFNSAPGYDKIGATVHGDPAFVAKVFGIQDFNGKVSSLMKTAVAIDEYFKKQYGAGQPGKA